MCSVAFSELFGVRVCTLFGIRSQAAGPRESGEMGGSGHCATLSPFLSVTQYSFATLKPQQIEHLALWRSFVGWNGQCSLRTWVYRVAHNAATSHVSRQRRVNAQKLVSLEELEHLPDRGVGRSAADT